MGEVWLIKNEAGLYEEREVVEAPLWWHTLGLQQTASGYGLKLTTPYKIQWGGKQRRVYCAQISNTVSLFVMVGKAKQFLGV